MEDLSSFCWPEGSQDVSNPFPYLNFSWPDLSPESIEPDDDEFFCLPADASSADELSAIFSSHRSLSNDSPSAAQEQNLKQRPETVAEPEVLPSFKRPRSSNISFRQPAHSSGSSSTDDPEPDPEAMTQIKEMIYQAAAFRPVSFVLEETVVRPRRKNVKISSDPQTSAARRRREQISKRIRVLQKLVPGGTKMDTASMLDEAANYLKFLKEQVKAMENARGGGGQIVFSPVPFNLNSYMQLQGRITTTSTMSHCPNGI